MRELAAAGLDPARLDALAAERSKARQQRAAEARERATQASFEIARRLAETPRPVLPADPDKLFIEQVTFIRTFLGGGTLIDSNVGPFDNWALYQLKGSASDTKARGVGRLSFFTLWSNPRNAPVTVTVRPGFGANAHLSVDADWNGVAAWFISGSDARATVRVRTTLWAMWNPGFSAISGEIVLADSGAIGGFFGDDGGAHIVYDNFLPGSPFVVPALASILIEVEVLTDWAVYNGSIRLDAESGAQRFSMHHLALFVS
jgi:hypothetical protein